MAREQDLLAAFIEFADTVVVGYDVVEFLYRLATRCVELVDVAEAGIMLADADGTLRYIASSSERMHPLSSSSCNTTRDRAWTHSARGWQSAAAWLMPRTYDGRVSLATPATSDFSQYLRCQCDSGPT